MDEIESLVWLGYVWGSASPPCINVRKVLSNNGPFGRTLALGEAFLAFPSLGVIFNLLLLDESLIRDKLHVHR